MSFTLSEDEALKSILKGFRVADEKNASREVGVWYANPDVEIRNQSYPYMTIELLDYVRATYRQSYGVIVDNDKQGTTAPVDNIVYTYAVPVPWDITYQIVTYARHPRHDRAIIDFLLNQVFPGQRGYLPVKDDLGTHTGYRHLILEDFTKRDTIENGKRLYRNVFTITVSSEGSAFGPAQTPVAQSVRINTTTPDIPPDLQPI